MFLVSLLVIVLCIGLMLAPMLFWDKGRRSLVLALRSLWLHKLRAFLSVLGIIIGTAAVISLMAFGEGSMQDALDDIKRQGATNIIVSSVKPSEASSSQAVSMVATYGLTTEDYDCFCTIPDLKGDVRMRAFRQDIYRLGIKYNGRVVATVPEYAHVHKVEMSAGRFLDFEDRLQRRNVAVLGSAIADKLFPYENPMDQTIGFGRQFYRVIGVVRERMPTGGSGGSQAAEQFNDDVYVPLDTGEVRYGRIIMQRQAGVRGGEQVELSHVVLTVDADIDTTEGREKVAATGDMIRDMLRRRHAKDDWTVTIPLDKLEAAEREKTRFTRLLALIASISLVVGGIGIMNIMLATVTERTREIGIRRALGAKRRDITLQFLVEAIVQTTVGGLLGVLFGLVIVFLVPWLAVMWETNLPAKVHVPSIFIALVVAVAVGVFFGLYPAFRASRLDPIEALRHE